MILENLAVGLCRLDELREQDFVHRKPTNELQRYALETAPLNYTNRTTQKQAASTWSIGAYQQAANQAPTEEWEIDYNYILLSGKSYEEICKRLQQTGGALRVSTAEIDRMITGLMGQNIECDAYEPVWADQPGGGKKVVRLVRSKDPARRRLRKVVDRGRDPATDLHAYAFSVAFLKGMLPHKLSDQIIQNLTLSDDEDCERLQHAAESGVMMDVTETPEVSIAPTTTGDTDGTELQQRLVNAMYIAPGDTNETALIRSIRDVMQYSAFGLTGACSVDEEDEIAREYADAITGVSPCAAYVTSEYPSALPTVTLFDDYDPRRDRKMPHEIVMVDVPASIRLKRNPACPLVHYNHMTVSPLARASLAVYQQMHGMSSGGIHEEDDADDVTEENNRPQTTAVQRKSFLVQAERATFHFQRDLDYTYCRAHLMATACPQPVADGRVINYPPHVYMNLFDAREEEARRQGKCVEFVQPYTAVTHRVQKMREMWNARRGDLSQSMEMSDFLTADYDARDMAAYNVAFDAPVRRRQPLQNSVSERDSALKSLRNELGKIASKKGSQTLPTTLARTPKSVQRPRGAVSSGDMQL